jgi:hypothetical protein
MTQHDDGIFRIRVVTPMASLIGLDHAGAGASCANVIWYGSGSTHLRLETVTQKAAAGLDHGRSELR